MENYSPTYNFNGTVTAANAPSGDSDLVRKQDVSGLSFISSIAAGSSDLISVSGGELSVSNLLVTDVKVDTSSETLAHYVSNTASSAGLGVGDIVILTAPTANLMYIVKSNDGTAVGHYEEIQSSLTAAEIASLLSGGTAISVSASGEISFSGNTDNVSEGSSNLYHTTARARSSISVTDSGGDGSLAYNSTTGVITYTGPSAAEVRAHFSSADGIDISDGAISVTADTDLINEGSSNLYHTTARARASVSVTDSGGDGSLAYNSTTGVITYTGPSASEARAHFSAGDGLSVTAGEFAIVLGDNDPCLGFDSGKLCVVYDDSTIGCNDSGALEFKGNSDDVSEGSSNLYHTAARARAAFSEGNGIAISAGSIALNTGYLRYDEEDVDLTASTAYNVDHNLSEKYVIVQVYDTNDNFKQVDVSLTNSNRCTVTSSSNLNGCYIVVKR